MIVLRLDYLRRALTATLPHAKACDPEGQDRVTIHVRDHTLAALGSDGLYTAALATAPVESVDDEDNGTTVHLAAETVARLLAVLKPKAGKGTDWQTQDEIVELSLTDAEVTVRDVSGLFPSEESVTVARHETGGELGIPVMRRYIARHRQAVPSPLMVGTDHKQLARFHAAAKAGGQAMGLQLVHGQHEDRPVLAVSVGDWFLGVCTTRPAELANASAFEERVGQDLGVWDTVLDALDAEPGDTDTTVAVVAPATD